MRFAGFWCRETTDNDLTDRPGKTQRTLFGLVLDLEKVHTTEFDKLDFLLGLAVNDASASSVEGHIIA